MQNFRADSNLGPVNFNPAPQANPIDAAMSGVERGTSLGLRRQQMEAMQQEKELQAQKLEQEKADKSISYLTDSKFSKFLSKETKLKLFKDNVVPVLNSKYGLNIDPSAIEHDGGEDGSMENLLNLIKNGATPDIIKHEFQQAILKSSPEELPMLKELGDSLKPDQKPFYFVDPGTKQMFDPNLSPIDSAPEGATPRMLSNPAAGSEISKRNGLVTGGTRSVEAAQSLLTPNVLNELKAIKYTPGKMYSQLASKEAKKFFRNLKNAIANELYIKSGATANDAELEDKALMYMPAGNDDVDDMGDRLKMLHGELSLFKSQGEAPVGGSETTSKTVTFTDSDGETHTIPANALETARKRDPGLRVQ